jgi:hypothetical protein
LNLWNEVSLGEEVEGEDNGVGFGNESRCGSGVVKEVSSGGAWDARRRVGRSEWRAIGKVEMHRSVVICLLQTLFF